MKLSERTEVLRRIDKDISTATEHAKIAHEAADKLAIEANQAQKEGKPAEMVKAVAEREWHLGAGMSWTSIKQRSISFRSYIEALPIDDIPDPSDAVSIPEPKAPLRKPGRRALVETAGKVLAASQRGKSKRK